MVWAWVDGNERTVLGHEQPGHWVMGGLPTPHPRNPSHPQRFVRMDGLFQTHLLNGFIKKVPLETG